MRVPSFSIAALALAAVLCAAPSFAEPVPTAEQLQRLNAQGPVQPMAPAAAPTRAIETVNVQGVRTPDAGYKLATGDKVRVTVYDETDLSGEFQVDGGGMIYLPLIGPTRAAGLSTQGLGAVVTAALANGYVNNPRVNVDVVTYRPFYIIGEVNKPGEYPYVNDMSAMNAVALAGGFTVKAATSDVYIRHEGSVQEESRPVDATTKIRPGDVLRVEPDAVWKVANFFSPVLPILNPACSLVTHTYC